MNITREQVENAVKSKGYRWFEKGDYNLNIVGIRNSSFDDKITNKFDDLITVSYKVNNKWLFKAYNATTDPGKYYSENLLNKNGVAILVPDQYLGSHKIGPHGRSRYTALRQAKPLRVYRDKNKDQIFDLVEENIQEGIFWINIHRATKWGTSKQIDKFSAGCQVIASNSDFEEFMNLCHTSAKIWGDSFTYTLIESDDINSFTRTIV